MKPKVGDRVLIWANVLAVSPIGNTIQTDALHSTDAIAEVKSRKLTIGDRVTRFNVWNCHYEIRAIYEGWAMLVDGRQVPTRPPGVPEKSPFLYRVADLEFYDTGRS